MPDLRSNWLPFYRPYSFASQPFDCFAENIQFRRSCIAVQPPFVRLPDYFFILSCSSSFVKILRPVFYVFAVLFHASRLLLFCSGLFSAASSFLPKKHPARRCLRELSQKRGFLEISSVSRRKHPHSRRNVLRFTPPPRAILSLAGNLCFLVPQSMLWYELKGTAAHRPVRFQYTILYV